MTAWSLPGVFHKRKLFLNINVVLAEELGHDTRDMNLGIHNYAFRRI